MEQMLSRPPQATKFPDGAYCTVGEFVRPRKHKKKKKRTAQVITHDERRGIAWTLFVEYPSQTMSFPSCEAL